MTKTIGELDYTKDEELNLGANYALAKEDGIKTGGAAELHIINLGEEIDSSNEEQTEHVILEDDENSQAEQEEDKPDNIQIEARVIAIRIKGTCRKARKSSFGYIR